MKTTGFDYSAGACLAAPIVSAACGESRRQRTANPSTCAVLPGHRSRSRFDEKFGGCSTTLRSPDPDGNSLSGLGPFRVATRRAF